MKLRVENLSVTLSNRQVLSGISFGFEGHDCLGIIGPSGSGKSVLALAIAGLLPEDAQVSGTIELNGVNLLGLNERERASVRGDQIGVVFQDPKSALNPLQTLGSQITEALRIHYQLSRQQRIDAAVRLATLVGLEDSDRILDSYPHQVSGGQRQRAAIAAALAAEPELVIADEPTTALDVTVQHEILELFARLRTENQASLLFISHDIAVLAQIAQHVIVVDHGEIVERGDVRGLLAHPKHPVTKQLVDAARAAQISSEGGDVW